MAFLSLEQLDGRVSSTSGISVDFLRDWRQAALRLNSGHRTAFQHGYWLGAWYDAFHGVVSLGGTVATINHLSTVDEVSFYLNDANARYLFAAPGLLDRAREAAARSRSVAACPDCLRPAQSRSVSVLVLGIPSLFSWFFHKSPLQLHLNLTISSLTAPQLDHVRGAPRLFPRTCGRRHLG